MYFIIIIIIALKKCIKSWLLIKQNCLYFSLFYRHCKTLAPVFDEVAEELKGVINVARVDCTQNSDIGSRFDIKGFPTLKLLTKGKVYTFKGRRSLDDIVAFAKGGYAKQDSEEVPRELGFFGKIAYTYSNAFKQAKKDILSGDLFSMDVLLVFLPVVLVLVFIVLFMLPIPDETAKPKLK